MLILSFKNVGYDTTRGLLNKHYTSLVEIEDFNALIDNKTSFDQPVKNKQESYEKAIEISGNDYYTTGNSLDFLCHQNIINTLV